MSKRVIALLLCLTLVMTPAFNTYALEADDTEPLGTDEFHEHQYDYTDNGDGTHDGICSAGDCYYSIKNEEHDFLDGECTKCGAKEEVETVDETELVIQNNGDEFNDENEEKKEELDEIEEIYPAFDQSATVNGVVITVTAAEGVFPADAQLSVERVSRTDEEFAEGAVEEVREGDMVVAVSYTFDIKALDSEGNELQPADNQKVTVSFSTEEVADLNLGTDVYHISEDGEAEKLITETNDDEVSAETDGFSFYTVEFTYHELQYVMEGDSTVNLDEILNTIGLEGEVSDVECSNEDLFSASKDGDDWVITAHRAFTSEEWMNVTINDVMYRIEVADAVFSDSITELIEMTQEDYSRRINNFISDSRWENGAYWRAASYDTSGHCTDPGMEAYTVPGTYSCFGYASDFTKQVYGVEKANRGIYYTDMSEVRAGDTIQTANTSHTAVVLGREDNKLWTAEAGTSSNTVRISKDIYTVSDGSVFAYKGTNNQTRFTQGYHFANVGNHDPHNPVYNFERVYSDAPNTITVEGWAFDPDDTGLSLTIKVFDASDMSKIGEITANALRTDVNDAYGCGSNHGFAATLPVDWDGTYEVCLQISNLESGDDVTSASKSVSVERYVNVTGVSITGGPFDVGVNKTRSFQATVSPSNATNKKVVWSSDDSSIATVDQNGIVTGISAGKTHIVATTDDGGFTSKREITVMLPLGEIDFIVKFPSNTVYDGNNKEVTATIVGAPADYIGTVLIRYYDSEGNSIADAPSNIGSYSFEVEATADQKYYGEIHGTTVWNFSITQESVQVLHVFTKSSVTLELGDSVLLRGGVDPSNATNKNITWSSDDPSVATVEQSGRVKAVAVGETYITVTSESDNSKSAKCKVTVTNDTLTPTPTPTVSPTPRPTSTPTPTSTPKTTMTPTSTSTPRNNDSARSSSVSSAFSSSLSSSSNSGSSSSQGTVNPNTVTVASYMPDASGERTLSGDVKISSQEQGAVAKLLFKLFTPAGWKEAFTFNLTVNGTQDYTLKKGKLTFYIPPTYRKQGRTFALISIVKPGQIKYFLDTDKNPETITVDLDCEGYAFDLIYFDLPTAVTKK